MMQQLDAFQDQTKLSYNVMKGSFYCDPINRLVQNVQLVEITNATGASSEEIGSYTFLIQV